MLIPARAAAYTVGGVVEFTYSSYKTKIGNVTSTSSSWSERYDINAVGFILDPRFLRLSGDVGYTRQHTENSPDMDVLTYTLNGQFFPGRLISADLNASKTILTLQGSNNLEPYEIDTTSYGVTLGFRFSKIKPRFGNINNNINNNNNSNSNSNSNSDSDSNNNGGNSRRPFNLVLPDIYLSYSHQESQSASGQNPIHETRDNTSGNLFYRPKSSIDLSLAFTDEVYKNLQNGSSYDTTTGNLTLSARVTSNADLKINSALTDRTVNNINGVTGTLDRTESAVATLDFREQNRFSHGYAYAYTWIQTDGTRYQAQSGSANLRYQALKELGLDTGLAYSAAESIQEANAIHPYSKVDARTEAMNFGAHYFKAYSLPALDPFLFNTGYDFGSGYSSVSSSMGGDLGGGFFYQNNVFLGLQSTGWKYEVLGLDWNYSSKRDHSPASNNFSAESWRLTMSTIRVPRTNISGSLSYSVQDSSTGPVAVPYAPQLPGSTASHRTLSYNFAVDHMLNGFTTLSAGATQGKTQSSSTYTLSTIDSHYNSRVRQLYAQATFNYQVSRNLSTHAMAREEKMSTDSGPDQTAIQCGAGLNYRFRQVSITADYRWRQDIPENGQRTTQDSFYVKISRPF